MINLIRVAVGAIAISSSISVIRAESTLGVGGAITCGQSVDGRRPLTPIPESIDQCQRWELSSGGEAEMLGHNNEDPLRALIPAEIADPLELIQSQFLSPAELARNSVEPPAALHAAKPGTLVLARAEIAEYQEITRTVQDWAKAWSRKDVERYLEFYSLDFTPAEGRMPAPQWREQRRQRLAKSGVAEVKVRELKIELVSADQAEAVFIQEYRDAGHAEISKKSMQFKRQDNRWRIVGERATLN